MRILTVNMFINIVLLFVFVIIANGDDICNNNDAIHCQTNADMESCTIFQDDAEIISQAISSCSAGSVTGLTISINSVLQSTTINITLNLANNIQTIDVGGHFTPVSQPVFLTATRAHHNVSRIRLYSLFVYNSGVFYAMFPNVTYFNAFYGYFGTNFSSLKKLTYLSIFCFDTPENTMDKETNFGGLSKLLLLRLNNCGIQNITTAAFSNLHSLTYLDLQGNDILKLVPEVFRDLNELTYLNLHDNNIVELAPEVFRNLTALITLHLGNNNISELVPEVFRDLTALKSLYIYGNNHDITICKDGKNNNTFSPLKQLTSLDLGYTKIIPDDAFTTLSSIQTLYPPQSSSSIFPSTLIQHLHNLTTLFFDDPLKCNCSMQWASIVPKFGIYIYGRCTNSGSDITNSNLYTECEVKSYQCFNKSSSCDTTCIDIPDSYKCAACDEGYGLSETEDACYDIDECFVNTALCEQKCSNTLGSYQCYCDAGYRLLCDLISCTDIDECSPGESNSCESHQCMNEPGSYRCICNDGFQLSDNNISCDDTDECMNTNNSCNPHTCLNLVGSYNCSCGEGYNNSTDGKSCEDIDECSFVQSNSCGGHQCMNEPGSYSCVCFEGFQLSDNNTSCHDTDECLNTNNSCNPHTCLNLVGSYTCSCGEGYQLATNGKTCEDRPTNASLPILSANSSTGFSNGTLIGVIVFLVIIIFLLTLLLLTLLSIITYMRYNKRKTTINLEDLAVHNNLKPKMSPTLRPDVSIFESVVYTNHPKKKECIELSLGLSPPENLPPLVEKEETHYSEPFYSEISPQMNMESHVISNKNDLKELM